LEKESIIIIIQDSRERKPLIFSHPYIEGVKIEKLIVGDYHVEYKDKFRPNIIFERKSQNDAVQTLTQNYRRYRKEILRAIENKILLVMIIECSLTKFIKGIPESQRSGEEMLSQLFTISLKYKIPFVFCNTRQEAIRFITEVYLAIGRKRLEDGNTNGLKARRE